MNDAEFIAKILKAEGIESVTCFPSNPLIEAVAKEGIRPISFRHERGAVMACRWFQPNKSKEKIWCRYCTIISWCRERYGRDSSNLHQTTFRYF